MNKEIKFRGKCVETNKWIYGYYAKTVLGNEVPLCVADCRIHDIIIKDGSMYYVKSETVGQYIGTNDMYNKEVYEGDVIRSYNYSGQAFEKLSVVEYDESYLIYRGIDIEMIDCEEIIGNIYENPELMNL